MSGGNVEGGEGGGTVPVRGRLVGVGVGPGDPDLVTIRAVRTLERADVVFVPVSEGLPPPGRAEATVRAHVTHDRIRQVAFRMTGDADYDAPAVTVSQALREHPTGSVAFATIGDPNVYSTFTTLAARVRALLPEVTIETVPGIMAMQDLAARSGTVLAVGTETVALLPLTAGVDAYRRAVADHDTVIAYKGGRALPQVLDVLAEADRLAGTHGAAVYGACTGLPEEDIRLAADLPRDQPGPYLSTVISTRRRQWPV
ncbi:MULTISPECIES: precorrin-2 C(20)-methyltransferase [Protofrankia]|uniref:Precorrin-2 C20-methyltransferase n=1 Tax=Candidatus Protofrankia datiscae TaxID=2716812 RepID=F8B0I9_9ACTN|nr:MULTISPECIES: precorrin-2 C(20)-methyltransferase [Protofrankia]AEH09738.1 precorrin-2 C20-methyltransferase [Candidatus Protofrankia datiscae]